MEKLIENLQLYEIVMLVLGTILFLTLCTLLVMKSKRNQSSKSLYLTFFLPIIMIGYPMIKEIQVGNLKISLYEKINNVLENPEDKQAFADLAETVEALENRVANKEEILALSEANVILNKPDKAIELANKSKSIEARPIKNHYEIKQPTLNAKDIESIASFQKEAISKKEIKDTAGMKNQFSKISSKNNKLSKYLSNKIKKQVVKKG